ncbi:hypothetical protein QQG74_30685 [Micromonospora sp. FIMYZ51]
MTSISSPPSSETVSPAQLVLVAAMPVGFAALTVAAWDRLQLDR